MHISAPEPAKFCLMCDEIGTGTVGRYLIGLYGQYSPGSYAGKLAHPSSFRASTTFVTLPTTDATRGLRARTIHVCGISSAPSAHMLPSVANFCSTTDFGANECMPFIHRSQCQLGSTVAHSTARHPYDTNTLPRVSPITRASIMRIAPGIIAALPVLNAIAAFVPADTSATDQLARQALDNVRRRASRRHASFSDQPLNTLASERGPKLAHGRHRLPRSPPSYTGPSDAEQKPKCTMETASVRREWDSLTRDEKRAYIDAVLCLMHKPPISGDLVPGARSRFDDFFGTHINQTLSIHGTGNFLSWHRYFTWTYEQALRHECGYTGEYHSATPRR